jgi:hypothetical protein
MRKTGLLLLGVSVVLLGAVTGTYAVDFKISGQINRAVMYADNGYDDEWFFVDNDNSSTRFRFTGSNDFENNFSVGIIWEVEMQSNPSNRMDIGFEDDTSNVHFDERKTEFWVGHKVGKLWVGQGDMASNGTAEVDLSGTEVITYSGVDGIGGGLTFRDDNNAPIESVGNTRSNFDGLSRVDRVRYDTPRLYGFYGSGSVGNGSIWDVALRYSGDLGFSKLAAAAAYADGGKRFSYDYRYSSSASLLFNFGLNLTASFSRQDFDQSGRDDPYNVFFKVGYKSGKHALSVQWSKTGDLALDGDKGKTLGAGYVFNPWESVDLYGGWNLYQLERRGTEDPDNINAFMIGGRVKF